MGAVYRAWDIDSERVCAVKLLHAESASRPEVAARFCDEARMISRLCHPNIVELWDAGQEPDQTLFLVMEHLQGQDLYSYLNVHHKLPLERALDLIQQVGSALHTVHLSGIVHRDIKPGNVFVLAATEPGARVRVKVIDFGLSKIFDDSGTNRGSDGLIIGTPEYLPPEAWRSDSSGVDARSDQWALGVLSYRVLSGRMPFGANQDIRLMCELIHSAMPQPLREQVPGLPAHIDAAVLRTMAKEKQQRFDSVLDFTRALRQLPLSLNLPRAARAPVRTQGRPVTLPGVRPLPAAPAPAKPPRPRSRWTLPAVSLLAGAVLASGLLLSGGVLKRHGWAAGLSRAFSMPVPPRAARSGGPSGVSRADARADARADTRADEHADEIVHRPPARAGVPRPAVLPGPSVPPVPSVVAPPAEPPRPSKRRRRKRPAAEVRPATADTLLLSEPAEVPRGLLPR